MLKQERKQIVRELLKKFLNEQDAALLKALKIEIMNQVGSAGYISTQVPETKRALEIWGTDLDTYIKAIEEEKSSADLKQNTHVSLIGLLSLIDTSQLPEK